MLRRILTPVLRPVVRGVSAASATAPPPLVDEQFLYPDGNLVGSVTPQGYAWANLQGPSNRVVGNKLLSAITPQNGDACQWLPTLSAPNCTIEAQAVITKAAWSFNVRARVSASNWLFLIAEHGNTRIAMGGTAYVVLQQVGPISQGAHTVKFDVRGSRLKGIVDDVTLLDVTLTAAQQDILTGTSAGISFYPTSTGEPGTAIQRFRVFR